MSSSDDKKISDVFVYEDLMKTSNKLPERKIQDIKEFDLVVRSNNMLRKNISLSPVKKHLKTY